MNKIWVLLSVENYYDQPEANLEAWWNTKPSFNTLCGVFNIKVDKNKGNADVGKILKGKEVRINNTDYRLEEIPQGVYKEEEK